MTKQRTISPLRIIVRDAIVDRLVTGNGILLRLRQPVLVCQLNGSDDMRDKRGEQDNSHHPKDRSEVVQEFCVRIDPVLAQVDLQISNEMTENVDNQNQSRKADNDFFPNRRLVKSNGRIFGKLPDRNGR